MQRHRLYVITSLRLEAWKTKWLEAALSLRRGFNLGTIVHDIGTPINALCLAFESLKADLVEGPSTAEA